jgi:glycerol 2-dehydrogenase (NADP+)
VLIVGTGDSIPAIGTGTWHVKGDPAAKEVKTSLQADHRHIDTAFACGNEKEVDDGIKASEVPHGDLWLTTKVRHPSVC